ncbi:hypothetical protein FGD67_09065 [Colwellia sp. M166]|uniref:hypothetical protein n=1 Tax=Colwellia sp. M166 TaxID=2583805 RepID=UPI00211DC8E5|nr:hypothetical protein [Colwellia sp. M166]UUO23348.1 hypothetical protein FGD67_09065 [Colwellia sp. M166]|tara:strand:- start:39811 stop:40449 length:639 start_codon:yes stop_codon:yes gene_type:complete
MQKGNSYILLDERWKLEDFAILTKEYMQLYGFFYALRSVESNQLSQLEFERMPWLGGGSVVGFFSIMGRLVPPENNPEVKRIQYASPGFIELTLITEVAKDIGIIVSSICASIASIAGTYSLIYSQYQKRKLTQLKIKDLEAKQLREEIIFVKNSIKQLHEGFSLTNNQVQSLHKISKGDELVQLKMLLALYRRAKPIAELQANKKANFKKA